MSPSSNIALASSQFMGNPRVDIIDPHQRQAAIMKICIGALFSFLSLTLTALTQPPQPYPVKVDMSLQWNIRLVTPQQQSGPSAPWYVYFPYDCETQCPKPNSMYPNWPHPFPGSTQQDGQQKTAGGTVTSVSNYLQPVGSNRSQAPSYWYR